MTSRFLFAAASFGLVLIAPVYAETAARKFLINGKTGSPILQLATPKAGTSCAAKEVRLSVVYSNQVRAQVCDNGKCKTTDPNSLTYRDRSTKVDSVNLRVATGDPVAGPVEPVTGADGLLWLCREDEAAGQCICIPWAQD
ncbi:MAG: hypothetical protein IT162_04835 [Bryobacterales bacterium]|nr:hypothetical protein [Bryobacterales bacterium]